MDKKLFLNQFMAWFQDNYFYVQWNLWEDEKGYHFTYPQIIEIYLSKLG